MKIQFGSLVTLAIFYNSVTAAPVPAPATAMEAVVPNISDATLNTAGNLIATLFQAFAPASAFNGASGAVGACYEDGSGGTVCPRAEASDDANITDAAFNTAGNILATLFQAFAPNAALNGALGAVGACYPNGLGGMICPRDESSDDAGITDAALNAAGNFVGTIFKAIAPSAAFNGASGAVGACYPNGYGGIYCPRDESSDDASITDAALNTAGNLLATFFGAFAPSAAFNGASGAVGACYPNGLGGMICPRDDTTAAVIDDVSKPELAL